MSDATPSPVADSREAARAAGLRFCIDTSPGFSRRRRGRGFSYRDRDGATIRDPEVIRRIRAMAIPPAWTDVWICPWPSGHVQATGRDARGRKQHRYHPDWRSHRDETKFGRLIEFAGALPAIRARVDADLSRPGLPREKVLATVVRLLELTLIRVGNDEYSRLNRSFGLTTLRNRHATVRGSSVRFRFRGKGGKQHEVGLRDRRLAALVRRCQELPGQELFQYREAGEVGDVTSDDVNAYIREASGGDFTAKDFRTWAGTVLAYRALRGLEAADGEPAARRNVVQAIRTTAGLLGNTAAVCRASYVHPAVLDAYVEGRIAAAAVAADTTDDEGDTDASAGLGPDEEGAVLRLLRRRLEGDAGRTDARRTEVGRGGGRAGQAGARRPDARRPDARRRGGPKGGR